MSRPPEWIKQLVESGQHTYQELGHRGGKKVNKINDWVTHKGRLYVHTRALGWHEATERDKREWAEMNKQLLLPF